MSAPVAILTPAQPLARPLPPVDAPIRGQIGDDTDAGVAPAPAGGWLGLAVKIVFGALGIGVALALAMVGLVLVANPAHARSPAIASDDRVAVEEVEGAVLLLDRCGTAVAAPLLSSEARITVTGPVLRARVTQRFINDFAASEGDAAAPACEPAFIEATYLFPMADGAAVDHLRLVVGDRIIEGQIREKQAAVRAHEQARAEGRRTALLEARRPNAFSTRVANIAPGETISIEFEYQQTLAPVDNVWQLRFPTVVAPRYSREPDGGDLAQPYVIEARDDSVDVLFDEGLDEGFGEWLQARRAEPDFGPPAETVKPGLIQPVAFGDPSDRDPHPLTGLFQLTVTLDSGVPIITPRSPSHQVATTAPAADGSRAWQVVIDEAGPGDRDFVLEWQPRESPLPRAGLRLETYRGETYGLLIVDPPRGEDADRVRLPRETTFVIDTSGSMGGQSIEQARTALLFALDRLMPGDAFNLIEFNSRHRELFDAPVVVNPRTLATARRWVRGLKAQGGTEMRGAVTSALAQPPSAGRLGQVIFITDGAVDYEEDLVSQIGDLIGDRRLFTVAIGSAPNSWFLRKAAEIGGGTLTQIGSTDEVERRMAALFTRLARPASTDLALDIEGATLLQPARLPRDLYVGDPLVTVLRLSGEPGLVRLKGRHEAPWEMKVDIAHADDAGAGLHALWARSEIESIEDRLQREAAAGDLARDLRAQATRIAIDHHLVSRFTSLVAIDPRVVRAPTDPLVPVAAPAAWPAGWALPQTATPSSLQWLLGILLLIAGFGLLVQRRVCAWLAGLCGGGR